ncbi:hypothetical protein NMS_2129 [Nonlabens marinus S1-08]|uniref:Uncharacterized protein n=1 Tax=Nonlabens marinus S1-08 TaxID=1454201 RepID=W8VW98_9FLAO|nr:hypothetical protein NMS_2129 [Nonlabens marinus S1-08]
MEFFNLCLFRFRESGILFNLSHKHCLNLGSYQPIEMSCFNTIKTVAYMLSQDHRFFFSPSLQML